MADVTLDPEKLRAFTEQAQADLAALHAEIDSLQDAIDERQREAHMLEARLKAVRERCGMPSEVPGGN